jgi:hypothetical protein
MAVGRCFWSILLLGLTVVVTIISCVEQGPQGEQGASGPSGQPGEVITITTECVPPFTHGVFHRAVRLIMPTMIRESHAVTLTPPSEVACRLPWGWRSSVFLAGMSNRLSMITACCYPLRHVSHSISAVAKGVTWR